MEDSMPSQVQVLSIVLDDNTAVGFTSISTTTHQAILKCETNSIRWRADGVAPTNTGNNMGMLMAAGDELKLIGADYQDFLRNFKIINAADGSNGAIRGAGISGIDSA
jgi:hypothetical protein